MIYKKYNTYKKQYSVDNGVTWMDVTPMEVIVSGDPVGQYETYQECEFGSYADQYLTFVALEDNMYFRFSGATMPAWDDKPMYLLYSLDSGETWVSMEDSHYTNFRTPTLNSGDTVMWKGPNHLYTNHYSLNFLYDFGFFSSTGKFNIEGNLKSLPYGDNFRTVFVDNNGPEHARRGNSRFMALFQGTDVVSAENLVIPNSQTLSAATIEYFGTFKDCKSLVKPPKLARVDPPNYNDMFDGCTSLTNAPELLAPTNGNYRYMFSGCTALTAVTCLVTEFTSSYPPLMDNWLLDVAPYGVFIKSSEMSSWPRGASGIPNGWAVVDYPYNGTPQYRWTPSGTTCVGFNKCVNNIKEVTYDSGTTWGVATPVEYSASTVLVTNSIACGYVPPATTSDYLTFYVGEDTTFGWEDYNNNNSVQYSLDSGSTWYTLNSEGFTPTVQAEHKIMFKGNATPTSMDIGCGIGGFSSSGMCVVVGNPMSLIHGDNFASHTSLDGKEGVFCGLFSGCEKLTNARNLFLTPTTLTFGCYSDMFEGCSYLTEGPVLSATTLENECYSYMFRNCSSLESITCLATNVPNMQSSTFHWNDGLPSTGIFYKDPNMTSWTIGGMYGTGIPSGWTIQDYS